jgi:hypothetical protein
MSDTQPTNPAEARLHYNDQVITLPKRLVDADPLSLFTKANFNRLPPECQARLRTLLPQDNEEITDQVLEKLWEHTSSYFRGLHPVKLFKTLLTSGYFTQVPHLHTWTEREPSPQSRSQDLLAAVGEILAGFEDEPR